MDEARWLPRARSLALVPVLLLWAVPARAQIVEVEVRGANRVRAQRPYLLERDGRTFLRGEPRWALEYDEHGEPTIPAREFYQLELFVSAPSKPEDVPYTSKGEAREPRWKAREAVLDGRDLVAIRVLSRDHTLETVAAEVHERRALAAALEKRRAGQRKDTEAWFDTHYLLLETTERLQSFLAANGFEPAARDMDGDVERLVKEAAHDPRWARGEGARAAIQRVETPARLVAASAAVSAGRDVFASYESRHLRLVALEPVDEDARALLAFGEAVIEGFRREHVDPYAAPDRIPERIFFELWLGPADDEAFGRYYEEYYGLAWGEPEERRARIARPGRHAVLGSPSVYLSYHRRGADARRVLAHRIGDLLGRIQFLADLEGGARAPMAWLDEAGGIEAAFQHLGAFVAPCVSLREDSTSVEKARGRRWDERPVAHQIALARECRRPLAQLLVKDHLDLGAADLAKGWSLYRFLADDGARGHAALEAIARLAREPSTFVARWGEELRAPYEMPPDEDPLDALERRWRASLPAD